MSYATPTQYLAKFGLAEATQLLADEQQLLTEQLLLDALAGTWTGTPSAEEQAAGTAAAARLVRELEVQSNVMDGYLRVAVTLPLADAAANAGALEDCCMALTRRGLADDSDNLTELVEKAALRWTAWLKDVAAGRAQLSGTDGEPVPSTRRVRSGQAASGFDWGSFGGVP